MHRNKNYNYIIIFVLGVVSALLFTFILNDPELLSGVINSGISVIIVLIILVVIGVFIFIFFKDKIFQKVLNLEENELLEIQDFAEKISTGNVDKEIVIGGGKKMFNIALKTYAEAKFRWWVLLLINSFFVGLAGLLGAYLLKSQNDLIRNQNSIIAIQEQLAREQNGLFKEQNKEVKSQIRIDSIQAVLLERQNELFQTQNSLANKEIQLLELQNEKIQQQSHLQEASRRNSFAILLNSVIESVNEDLRNDFGNDSIRNLSLETIASIISITNQFKPYKYLEGDSLITYQLSPERGQLLVFLCQSKLAREAYERIFKYCNFSHSDLKEAVFIDANLSELDLSASNFRGAYLRDVDFNDSFLDECDFEGATLLNLSLKRTRMHAVNLEHAKVESDFANQYLVQNYQSITSFDKMAKDFSNMESVFTLATYNGLKEYHFRKHFSIIVDTRDERKELFVLTKTEEK